MIAILYDERSMKYTLRDDNKEIDLSISKEEAEFIAGIILKDRLDAMTKKLEECGLIDNSNSNTLEELKSLKIRFNKLLDSYIDLANKFVKEE
jgi:Mg2+/Co2+ transporter CorB